MTTDPNTEWDYEKLMDALDLMQTEYHEHNFRSTRTDLTKENASLCQYKAESMEEAIKFIEYNMREMNIVSATEHYLTMK